MEKLQKHLEQITPEAVADLDRDQLREIWVRLDAALSVVGSQAWFTSEKAHFDYDCYHANAIEIG